MTTAVLRKTKTVIKRPRKYAVIVKNDNVTPMLFVTQMFRKYFGHDEHSANALMLEVHNSGSAVGRIYSFEVAEHKLLCVMDEAAYMKWPLQLELREVE